MDKKALKKELAYLLVAQLRGYTVDLLTRKSGDEPWEENGVGVSVGKGKTVRIDDVVDLVLKHAFEPTMVEANDDQMSHFLEGVEGVVMATREEQHRMWERHKEIGWIKSWESGSSGLMPTVGHLAGRPICITINKSMINGQKIAFVDPTSQLVDHKLVDEWVEATMPQTAFKNGRLNRTDATNFTNVLKRD